MKRTLLFYLMIISSIGIFSQEYTTGLVTLNSSLSAQLDISATTNKTTLTLKGPDNVWLAVGFGGSTMSSGADVFRTDGTNITDAKTTSQSLPAADAQQDWSLVSNTISNFVRTIVATRNNNTGDSDDFTFSASTASISLIWAYGSSSSYGYHAARGATVAGATLAVPESKYLDFEMYPNPASEELTIQLPLDSNNASVEFYDHLGRLTLKNEISEISDKINIQNLSSGVYILKIFTNNKVGVQKIIKK